jgi:2-oxoglutarate dehydrogenase E1 component
MNLGEDLSADFIDTQYRRWRQDPSSVPENWRYFFHGFSLASATGVATAPPRHDDLPRQSAVDELVRRYRELGHLLSCLDPLSACPTSHPLLELEAFGLEAEDLEREFANPLVAGHATAPLREILAGLRETYCRSLGVEFMHLQDPQERAWLQARMEPRRNQPALAPDRRRQILTCLLQATLFEAFLNKKYVAVTRFSLEGGESLIPLLEALLGRAAEAGCREAILGMAHRGRLNVQAHTLRRPYAEILAEFEHCYDPQDLVGAGDVKYHNGYLADEVQIEGKALRLLLVNNPSHLEAVDPVVEGLARGRQELLPPGVGPRAVLPLLIHGDAAFAGQGVVAETLNMSQLAGYRTGGTLHVVINNQIGYTTLPADARSTRYATDIAKMLMVPILHVHGEDPEAVVHAAHLAADYRTTFAKDVVIDLVCYRRYGHNEGDDPYFTQPQMVERIRNRPPVSLLYRQRLEAEGAISAADARELEQQITARLEHAYAEVHGSACAYPESRFYDTWDGYSGRFPAEPPETGVETDRLKSLARALNHAPQEFTLHPKLWALLQKRLETVEQGSGIDWANAEALAWASLLTQGVAVRLSGQDVGRGTFSQRHSVLVDSASERQYVPLNHLDPRQARFSVHNSLLAEAGVLGFEYGFSLARPDALVIWEAQFGDFANNAQAVFDLFIASGQAKWQRLSGLTLLLPHGLEGLGPEHSSARPERFLQLCAGDNLQVCQPSTPAQYFHLLRRHVIGQTRVPLVVLSPKSLLRHPQAVSELAELSRGGFQPLLSDPEASAAPTRLLLCSGKIYYELQARRRAMEQSRVAIVRLEQLYPFAADALEDWAAQHPSIRQWTWVQEEPENMGAWSFVRPRLEAISGKRVKLVSRPPSSTPATGFPARYRQEQAAIIDTALGPPRSTKSSAPH